MELRAILEMLWRRRRVMLAVFLSIFLTILVGTVLVTPWYDATSKVLLRKSTVASSILSSLGQSSQTSSAISDTDRSDYLALATVRPVAEKAISELDLKRERTRARVMKALPFLKPVLKALGVDVTSTEEAIEAEDLVERGLTSFIFPRPFVKVEQYETTDIITLEAISTDPGQASGIANAMAKAFVDSELRRVKEDFKGAKDFIQDNIKNSNNEYQKSLRALKDFKEREKSVNLDSETTEVLQKISDLRKSQEDTKLVIKKTKASKADIEEQLRKMPKFQKDSEQLKSNDMITSLKTSLRDLNLSLAETKTKYTSEHPAVKDIENKIEVTKRMIKEEAEKTFGSESIAVDPVYRDLTEKVATSISDLAGYEALDAAYPTLAKKYEGELLRLPKKSYDYAQLSLTASVAQDIYNTLLKSLYQVGIAESIAVANIYVVESAIPPARDDSRHKHPKLFLNFVIALVLGASMGVGAALVVEYLDDTLRTPGDVKSFKGLTFLGGIYKLGKKDERLVSKMDPRSPLRESFRTVRNSIRFATLDRPLKSYAVTSSIQDEGKSFFASNMAITMANEGKKVLLIDGDMRKPDIHSFFGLPNDVGLTNYLAGDEELEKVQARTSVEGLTVIPTGPIPPDPARLVESNRMRDIVKAMEDRYDLVIVDSPSVLAATDAVFIGGYTGGVVIVIESGRASRRHFHDVIEMFAKANVSVLGAVLNKVSEGGAAYYYKH